MSDETCLDHDQTKYLDADGYPYCAVCILVSRERAEAAAEEREACAKLAEELDGVGGGPIIPYSFTELAADIRARGNKP